MKFLIHNDINFQEELDGIANGLMANGDNVSGFHQTIFRAYEEAPTTPYSRRRNNSVF